MASCIIINQFPRDCFFHLEVLLHFLFGTAGPHDVNAITKDVQTLYENQMREGEVLDDDLCITNVSRSLITENRLKINNLIDSVLTLNETLANIEKELEPLFVTRTFLVIHDEVLIHSHRLRTAVNDIKGDIKHLGQYLNTLSSDRLNPNIIDAIHLRTELINIQKVLSPTLALPENPANNIWHFYKYLTITPVHHYDRLIMLIKIPLVDVDSTMTLHKVYNLPIFHPHIGRSLQYNIEGNNLATTKDRNYLTLLSEAEFVECTLAQGHFCSLKKTLDHTTNSDLCVSSLFLRNDKLIEKNCKLSITNFTKPKAIYLDQGHWAISLKDTDQMEISCNLHTYVITINQPLTFVTLQPACSAFSLDIKLPPYFKQFSKGFDVAIKTANLHTPKCDPVNFRIWKHFNLTTLSTTDKSNLKKLEPVPAVPTHELRAKISDLVKLKSKDQSWLYILGGDMGSGTKLLIIVIVCVYWRCRKCPQNEARSTSLPMSSSAPENPNAKHTSMGVTRTDHSTALGWEAVGIQYTESPYKEVTLNEPVQSFDATALLDQLEELGVDVNEHHRRLQARYYAALPSIEY